MIIKNQIKTKKTEEKMFGPTLHILGVAINSTSIGRVLNLVAGKIAQNEKFWIVTPNPEFLVTAQKDKEFKKILNEADLAIPDGFGLVLAARILRFKPQLRERVAGADVVEQILVRATRNGWRIGVVGARKGKRQERTKIVEELKRRYQGLKIENLEEVNNWPRQTYDIIFACQGMGRQERWIWQNRKGAKAKIFMGVGGALDFLAGFSPRAPFWLRQMGLEWLWRLGQRPESHLRRVYRALVVFPLLVLKEKMRR